MNGFEVRESGPGYLSLAIVHLKDNDDMARELQECFAPIPGIRQVAVDQAEGLLTVFFNYQQITSFYSVLALKGAFTRVFPAVNVWELAALLKENLQGE
jgi:hypothetical protein